MFKSKFNVLNASKSFMTVTVISLFVARCFGFTWTSQPQFTSGKVISLAYGNGTFVAVDNGGSVFTSPDATNWTSHAMGTTALFGVPAVMVFMNSNFVAVGTSSSNAVTQMSADGLSWEKKVLLGPGILKSVEYGNGSYVGVGETGTSGLIATSNDGINWSTLVMTNSGQLSSVAYGNGIFVVSLPIYHPATFSYSSKLFTSTDGLSWTQQTEQAGIYIFSIAYGNGIFVTAGWDNIGAGACLISPNGTDWRGPVPGVVMLSFGNVFFLGLNVYEMSISTDGVNWTPQLSFGEHVGFSAWTYGAGTFLVTGGSVDQSQDLSSYCFMSGLSDNTGAFHLTVMGGRTRQEYRIQGSTDLTGTNWTDVFSFTNSLTTDFLDSGATNYPQRFYRVVSP